MSIFSIKHVQGKPLTEARHELGGILAVSFMPLLLGFLVLFSQTGVKTAFTTVFLSGDLYFYVISFCAAMFVMAILRTEKGNRYLMLWVGIFVLGCMGLTATYIAQGADESEVTLMHGVVSSVMLIIAVWIHYRVLVITNAPPPQPESVNRNRSSNLADQVEVNYDDN